MNLLFSSLVRKLYLKSRVCWHHESDFFPKAFQPQLELPVQMRIQVPCIQTLALGVFSPRPRALGKQESLELALLHFWRGGHEAVGG